MNTSFINWNTVYYFALTLDQARNKESYRKKLKYYARADLLIIDKCLLNTTIPQQQSDILELLELRYDYKSTLFASQFLPEGCHSNLGGGAVADAILDRVIANFYLIHIKGQKSMRTRENKRDRKKSAFKGRFLLTPFCDTQSSFD